MAWSSAWNATLEGSVDLAFVLPGTETHATPLLSPWVLAITILSFVAGRMVPPRT